MSLRRYQFQLAQKNTAMAIWLGKQYLGQRDIVHQVGGGTQVYVTPQKTIVFRDAKHDTDQGDSQDNGGKAPTGANGIYAGKGTKGNRFNGSL